MMRSFLMGMLGAAALLALFQVAPKINPIPRLPVVLK